MSETDEGKVYQKRKVEGKQVFKWKEKRSGRRKSEIKKEVKGGGK